MKRAGHDLIAGYDGSAATFTDGTVEKPPAKGWRHIELQVAASHPAVRDVHVSSAELGVLWVFAEVAQGHDLDGFGAAVAATARPLVSPCHQIRVRSADW